MPLNSVIKYRFLINLNNPQYAVWFLKQSHHKAHKTQQLNVCAKLFYLQKQNGTKWQQGSHIHAQLSLIECSAEKFYLVSKDLGKALHRAEEMFVIKLLQRMCIIQVWTYSLHLMFPEPRDDPSTFSPYIQSITTEYRKNGGPYWKEFSFQDALLILKHSKCVEGNLNL